MRVWGLRSGWGEGWRKKVGRGGKGKGRPRWGGGGMGCSEDGDNEVC